MKAYFLLIILSVFLLGMKSSSVSELALEINDIQYAYGTLWVAVYASESSFLDKNQAQLISLDVKDKKSHKIILRDLSYGDYAIALFHDLNGNSEMDFNWAGVPAEPFAFSRPVSSKWRLPKFSEVKVGVYQSHKTINTHLATWWDR